MLLPQGTEKHKNLSTSFTKFEQLLGDLSENRFSGYMRLNFWEYEGVLVLDTGRIIEAYSSEEDVHLTGERAVLQVLSKATQDDGSIEVYELSNEIAVTLGYAIQAKLFKDESELSNYSLAQVFDMLERDGVTGYVDLQFSGNRGNGTVYYLEGSPVEAVIMSGSGKIASGEQVYLKFLEIGQIIQPHVRVFRVETPQPIVEDQAFVIPWHHQKYISFWNEFLQYLKQLVTVQLKKNKFHENFEKICLDISDHYPFLHPVHGDVYFKEGVFTVKKVIPLQTFLQGMSLVISRLLQQVPVRRYRKFTLGQIAQEVSDIAEKYDIQSVQIEPEKFVYQIFRGLLS